MLLLVVAGLIAAPGTTDFDTYVLVGTKHDLWKEKGGVTEDDYWAVAEKIGAKAVVMTSAKDKHNCPVHKALHELILNLHISHCALLLKLTHTEH